VLDFITNKHIPLVFLVAYWPKYVHDAELPNEGVFFDPSVPPPLLDKSQTIADNLDRLMHDLRRQGTKVVLVMDVPEMGYYMPEALAKAMIAGRSLDLAPPWDYVSKRQALSRALLSKAAKKYGNVIIDPLPEFCPNDHCDALRHGMPLYRDADHITATASIALSGLFEPILGSFARSNGAGAIVAPKA
jgi:nicotinamidase-related amidase